MSCEACKVYPLTEHQRVDVTEYRKNWPTTRGEAVKVVINTLTPDQRNALRDMPEDELIKLHLSLGMWIRNEFGLWRGNLKCDTPWRADEVSMTIIIMVWKELQRNKY